MNELIESILKEFAVGGHKIPFAFRYYNGHAQTYIVYMQEDAQNSFSGDDDLLGYVDYYDFDVYSKGNYFGIVEKLKRVLKQHNFTWQPSRSSGDIYEPDTGYFHKTLNFAYMREIPEETEG